MIGAQHRRAGIELVKAAEQRGCGSSGQIQIWSGRCGRRRRPAFAKSLRVRACRTPLTASTVVTTPPSTRRPAMSASVISVCRIGAGSASPLVSITMRSNGVQRPLVAPPQQVLQGLRQVGADFAAQAAGLQLDEAVLARFDQLVIESDLAELVDDDGGAREFRLAQQMAKHGRLAAAEKAGEDRDRDRVCALMTAPAARRRRARGLPRSRDRAPP